MLHFLSTSVIREILIGQWNMLGNNSEQKQQIFQEKTDAVFLVRATS